MVALALGRRALKDCANDPLLVRMAPEGAFHTEAGEDETLASQVAAAPSCPSADRVINAGLRRVGKGSHEHPRHLLVPQPLREGLNVQ